MVRYFAVIDTNVLVSGALKHESVPGHVLDLAFNGPITPVLNRDIEDEYREVLSRPKFHLTEDIVDDIIAAFRTRGLYIDAAQIDDEWPDPDDKVFYEVVMENRKDEETYLVTGNVKHFPTKPYVVTPRQMLNIILENNDLQP